jgi:hypothetical protein
MRKKPMDNIHYNTMNLLGKDLKIVYHPTSKLFTLIDCLGNEVATNSDGRKLIKFAWSFSPLRRVNTSSSDQTKKGRMGQVLQDMLLLTVELSTGRESASRDTVTLSPPRTGI